MCVSPELKQAVSIQAKYTKRYVEYANGKIEENPDVESEEMAGIGRRLERNSEYLDEFFNGKEE
jgi:hypothetical protein